jgi:putative hemolysin
MIEILLLLFLILLNGAFALSELAIVSARPARLEALAQEGRRGAQIALNLAAKPTRFLATVQIGITLIGVLTGALGSATLADDLSAWLQQFEPLAEYSGVLAVGIIVASTTYLSLLLGELAPKRLALQYTESIACWMSRPMAALSFIMAPLVSFLSLSTHALMLLLGIPDDEGPEVSEAEIRAMVRQGAAAGVFEEDEQSMVEGVFNLDTRRATDLMTPRTEITWLNLQDSPETIRETITKDIFAVYPVCDGSLDQILGILKVKDLAGQILAGQAMDLRALLHKPIYIPETLDASQILERFRAAKAQAALVLNEYGEVEGLVTINDVLAEIVDVLEEHEEEPDALQRADGSWLLDGLMPIDRLKEVLPHLELPDDEKGDYNTLAGFVLMRLGHIPKSSEHFTWGEFYFEVMDMDGRRVDKVLARQATDIERS